MAVIPDPTRSLEEQIAALRSGAGARALQDRVFAVRGEDRVEWLSGLATNDTKALGPGQSCYTTFVHVKGKILTDAWVHARRDEFWLVLPRECAEPLQEHLERYVIMEDVEVVVLEGVSVVTVQGPRAREVVPLGEAVFAADRLGRGGVDCIVRGSTDAGVLVQGCEDGSMVSVGEPAWEVARLESGVPRFGLDFDGQNFVQEANITPRAVSFHKGCYVGQEMVCRLEMRGHVRKQLVSVVLEGEPPAAGTALDDGAGVITSAAFSPALGRTVALAMVPWDLARAKGPVGLAGRAGQLVERPVP